MSLLSDSGRLEKWGFGLTWQAGLLEKVWPDSEQQFLYPYEVLAVLYWELMHG